MDIQQILMYSIEILTLICQKSKKLKTFNIDFEKSNWDIKLKIYKLFLT